jgi:hypothetical protein
MDIACNLKWYELTTDEGLSPVEIFVANLRAPKEAATKHKLGYSWIPVRLSLATANTLGW